MVSLATPVLEDLSRETGEASHFAVRMGDAVVVIARTGGAGAFQLTGRMGVVRPAHCTALGKIILAALRPEQLDAFLERAELKAFTAKSITEAAALRREIEEVRRAGIAFDDGEFDPELRCVGVPVRDFSGRLSVPSAFPGRSGVFQSRLCRAAPSWSRPPPPASRPNSARSTKFRPADGSAASVRGALTAPRLGRN